MNPSRLLATLLPLALLAGCGTSSPYQASGPLGRLQIQLTDPAWDGRSIPPGQHCRWAGGHGSTPPLRIDGIPQGANALIVEFSDHSWFPMDHGGHGSIGIRLQPGQRSASLPVIAGESFQLPAGLFLEHAHRGGRGEPGAYLPPCSGGRGNHYYATVRAVYKPQRPEETPRLLAEESIELGKY